MKIVNNGKGYVIAFVHNGTDIAVIDGEAEEHEDCIYQSHSEAMEAAKKLAVTRNMDLYDFSTQGELK